MKKRSVLNEAYVSTIGSTFVTIRVILSNVVPDIHVAIFFKDGSSFSKRLTKENKISAACHFWSLDFNNLKSSTKYCIKVITNKKIICSLHFSTLRKPKGKFLYSFGILPDVHINTSRGHSGGSRLYYKSIELTQTYVKKLGEMGSKFIILSGDVCDCGSKAELSIAKKILSSSPIPCYPIIGNHEVWSGSEELFNATFGLDKLGEGKGFYAFDCEHVRFILLATADQGALDSSTLQSRWLEKELETHKNKVCLLFCHFSFVLHPCVQGWKNDGLQQLYNHKKWLRKFSKYANVKVVFAGHKNVPSVVYDQFGLCHVLSAQLIQCPTAYDVVEVYEGGLVRMTFEIDEIDLVIMSKKACGSGWKERFGSHDDRHFVVDF